MIRKIVFVSEAPESHDELPRSLAAAGFQVVPQTTLRAAVSVLRDVENVALVMVVDGPAFSAEDAEMLASLSVKHPQVRMMIFVSRGMPEETLNQLRSCRPISIYNTALGDGTSTGLILKALTEAIAHGATYEATLMEAMAPGNRSSALRARRVRGLARAHRSPRRRR